MARQSILRILPLFRLWTGELISAEKVYSLIAKQMSPSLLFGFKLSQPFPPSCCWRGSQISAEKNTLTYANKRLLTTMSFSKGVYKLHKFYHDLFELIRQPPYIINCLYLGLLLYNSKLHNLQA